VTIPGNLHEDQHTFFIISGSVLRQVTDDNMAHEHCMPNP